MLFVPTLLCALQDPLLALLQNVFVPSSPADDGLRGGPLAGAALQLLPLALTPTMCPPHPHYRQIHRVYRLVRLTCKRRCVPLLSITLAAVNMTEVTRCLWLTLQHGAEQSQPPGRAGGNQDHYGCLQGLKPLCR